MVISNDLFRSICSGRFVQLDLFARDYYFTATVVSFYPIESEKLCLKFLCERIMRLPLVL